MCGYSEQIQAEITKKEKLIDQLYDRLKSEGTKNLIEIYREIAAHQQSIRAKKQMLENNGPSGIPVYHIPSKVNI